MSKALATLIKLAHHKVDKVQKDLASLRNVMQALDADMIELEREVRDGGALAVRMEDPSIMAQAAAFAGRAKIMMDALKERRVACEVQEQEQLVLLAEHFSAQKRYETLQMRQQHVAKRAYEAKIQKALDEAAGVSWSAEGVL